MLEILCRSICLPNRPPSTLQASNEGICPAASKKFEGLQRSRSGDRFSNLMSIHALPRAAI